MSGTTFFQQLAAMIKMPAQVAEIVDSLSKAQATQFPPDLINTILQKAHDFLALEGGYSSVNPEEVTSPEALGASLAEQVHRRKMTCEDFLVMLKSIRQALLSRFVDQGATFDESSGFLRFLSFFDRIEIAVSTNWFRDDFVLCHRRLQEQRLANLREKKRYATVFYRMTEPAFVVDPNLKIVDVNPAFEKFFNQSKYTVLGKRCCDVIGHQACEICALEEAINNDRSFSSVEITVPPGIKQNGQEGKPRTMLMAGTSLGRIADKNTGGVVILQDISETKALEQELEEYRCWLEEMVEDRTEELLRVNGRLSREITERKAIELELTEFAEALKRSNVELERFAHVASHDLKEPLMLIEAFSGRLIDRYTDSLDERGREYLTRIVKASGQLQRLVDGLLDMSRVNVSEKPFEVIELSTLMQEVVDNLGEMISRSVGSVEIDTPHIMFGDAIQIRQLFQNIIANALKFHQEGMPPHVRVVSRLGENEMCEIEVTDNGIGFDESEVERIFQPFQRLHGKDKYDGSGLGLATCARIVDRHCGRISARSKPGFGSTFVISLPVQKKQSCDINSNIS